MVSKFGQLDRAIGYLCEAILRRGELWADLVYVPDGVTLAQRRLIPKVRVRSACELLCQRFQEAAVVCDVLCDGHCIAGIQCRCREHATARCRKGCIHHHDRPLVGLVLRPKEEAAEEGLCLNAIRLIHESIHAFQLEEKKRRDRHHAHAMRFSM